MPRGRNPGWDDRIDDQHPGGVRQCWLPIPDGQLSPAHEKSPNLCLRSVYPIWATRPRQWEGGPPGPPLRGARTPLSGLHGWGSVNPLRSKRSRSLAGYGFDCSSTDVGAPTQPRPARPGLWLITAKLKHGNGKADLLVRHFAERELRVPAPGIPINRCLVMS